MAEVKDFITNILGQRVYKTLNSACENNCLITRKHCSQYYSATVFRDEPFGACECECHYENYIDWKYKYANN